MKKVFADLWYVLKGLFRVVPKAEFYGRIKVFPGQRLFEFNYIKGEIEFAVMVGKKSSRNNFVEFEIRDNCKYAPAINIEGACKKFGLNVKIKKE